MKSGRQQSVASTLGGRTVMVAPVPPALPLQIIPAGSIMGIPGDFAKDITPEGVLQ